MESFQFIFLGSLLGLLSLLIVFAFFLVRLILRQRIQQILPHDDDPIGLHYCTTDFHPRVLLDPRDFDGDEGTVTLHVLKGIYCSICGQEIECSSCRKVVAIPGAVLAWTHGREVERLTRCCERPRWIECPNSKQLDQTDRERLHTVSLTLPN